MSIPFVSCTGLFNSRDQRPFHDTGPSGSGKTTLLDLIGGRKTPSVGRREGDIIIDGLMTKEEGTRSRGLAGSAYVMQARNAWLHPDRHSKNMFIQKLYSSSSSACTWEAVARPGYIFYIKRKPQPPALHVTVICWDKQEGVDIVHNNPWSRGFPLQTRRTDVVENPMCFMHRVLLFRVNHVSVGYNRIKGKVACSLYFAVFVCLLLTTCFSLKEQETIALASHLKFLWHQRRKSYLPGLYTRQRDGTEIPFLKKRTGRNGKRPNTFCSWNRAGRDFSVQIFENRNSRDLQNLNGTGLFPSTTFKMGPEQGPVVPFLYRAPVIFFSRKGLFRISFSWFIFFVIP